MLMPVYENGLTADKQAEVVNIFKQCWIVLKTIKY